MSILSEDVIKLILTEGCARICSGNGQIWTIHVFLLRQYRVALRICVSICFNVDQIGFLLLLSSAAAWIYIWTMAPEVSIIWNKRFGFFHVDVFLFPFSQSYIPKVLVSANFVLPYVQCWRYPLGRKMEILHVWQLGCMVPTPNMLSIVNVNCRSGLSFLSLICSLLMLYSWYAC